MRVKVNKVGTLDNFNNCMLRVLQERRKAENVFLEDVEAEILQKEQFLKEQIEMLQEMSNNFNTLLEHKSVVAVAAEVIKGAQQAEAVRRHSEIEEKKHEEIQLQEIDAKAAGEGAAKPATNKDQLKEERVPLIAERVVLPGMISIRYMAGTILKEDELKFKRMIFRASRGRALSYFRDLDSKGQSDYAGILDKKMRAIYVIVFQDG